MMGARRAWSTKPVSGLMSPVATAFLFLMTLLMCLDCAIRSGQAKGYGLAWTAGARIRRDETLNDNARTDGRPPRLSCGRRGPPASESSARVRGAQGAGWRLTRVRVMRICY